MALNIKNPEADRVARELVELTGETITDAVIAAMKERIERERAKRRYGSVRGDVHRIRERYRALPLLDDMSTPFVTNVAPSDDDCNVMVSQKP